MLDTSRTNQVTGTITSGVRLHNSKEISLRHIKSAWWAWTEFTLAGKKWHVNLMLLHKIKSAHIYLSSNDYFLSTSKQLNSTNKTKQRIWFLSHLIDRKTEANYALHASSIYTLQLKPKEYAFPQRNLIYSFMYKLSRSKLEHIDMKIWKTWDDVI